MKKEQKDLLLQDLCSRLPYGVKCDIGDNKPYTLCRIEVDNKNGHLLDFIEDKDGFDVQCYLSEVKPYLFPLSSLTAEQIFLSPFGFKTMDTIRKNKDWTSIEIDHNDYYELTDWFNKNHYDYRGLIEKGLAIDATNLGIYE